MTMKRALIATAAMVLGFTAAMADSKPTDEEAKKIQEALKAMDCEGGAMEKETEGSGVFEADDVKCKWGGQWDVKLNKDFQVISLTRD